MRWGGALAAALALLVAGAQPALADPAAPAPSASDAGASGAASPLDALFVAFGKSPGLFAKFREEKQIALLVAPLKSEGTVHFERFKGLARHTTAPQKRSLLLNGGTLTVWDGTKTEVIQLTSQPALRAFADSFSMFLAADRQGLEKVFRLELTADPRDPKDKWKLRLVPLAPQLQKMIKELELVGQSDGGKAVVLSTLRVAEANGDVSTTTFYDVDTNKKYTASEAAAVFRVPGPSS
jgi:hypothetical protein